MAGLTTSTDVARPFTPNRESADRLEARTVGRGALLHVLAERLDNSATTRNRHHTLLVGPRGSGKTHLLRVALHQLKNRPAMAENLVIARLAEDVVGITRYLDLLRDIAHSVGIPDPADPTNVTWESAILDALGERVLVLVIENLDRLFTALGLGGQRDLRSWVETSGRILLLAATPALFSAVKERSQPWFGGLIITPVEALSAEDGHALLSLLAKESGKKELYSYLQTESGRGRVQALSALTGGSARNWTILADTLTVESLDALIPAVEGLIESLVPYYQSRLWDLPANHQAIIRQLATGEISAMTPAEIATATGLSQQTVGKALGLLQESRWVRAEKLPVVDRRQTWYQLREPMLRHHFQWRATDGKPLRLIVMLLRGWYDPAERRRRLVNATAGSDAEADLPASLADQPQNDPTVRGRVQDPARLSAEAKTWILGDDALYTVDCGRYTEACLAVLHHGDPDSSLRTRAPAGLDDGSVVAAIAPLVEAPLATLLTAAAGATHGETAAGLRLLAAGIVGPDSPEEAVSIVADLDFRGLRPALSVAVRVDTALWRSQSSRDTSRRSTSPGELGDQLLREVLNLDAPGDLLCALLKRLTYYLDSGRTSIAGYQAYARLVSEQRTILGPDHPDTLRSRMQLAFYTHLLDDPAIALARYRCVAADLERIEGPTTLLTLEAKLGMGGCLGKLGDQESARAVFSDISAQAGKLSGPGAERLIRRAELAATHCQSVRIHAGPVDIDEALSDVVRPGTTSDDWQSLPLSLLLRSPREPAGSLTLQLLWRALRGDPKAKLQLPPEVQALVRDTLGC